ncbi:MAG: hypothetical protein LN408_03320 [Candidatus Thermoplasmatota archaeon]|nr:hypothetical protein [Candidatus Thermoplasmatota archaeon]
MMALKSNKKDYEECKKYMGDNICNIAHPFISYCDVNRDNLQCPEKLEPSKDIDESERTNQIIIEYKLKIGIKMLEKIRRVINMKTGYYEDINEYIIDSIRHSFNKNLNNKIH